MLNLLENFKLLLYYIKFLLKNSFPLFLMYVRKFELKFENFLNLPKTPMELSQHVAIKISTKIYLFLEFSMFESTKFVRKLEN